MSDRGELYIKICGRLERNKVMKFEREISIGLDARRKKRQGGAPPPMGLGLKQLFLIPEIPKVPTVGGEPLPSHTHPPLGRYAPLTRGQFAPSLSYLPLFSNISCLMPDTVTLLFWLLAVMYFFVYNWTELSCFSLHNLFFKLFLISTYLIFLVLSTFKHSWI